MTPTIFDILERHQGQSTGNLLLTPALQGLAETKKYLALEMKGTRYNPSRRHGLLRAQLAFGLAGEAHDETLTTMVELLAEANGRYSLLFLRGLPRKTSASSAVTTHRGRRGGFSRKAAEALPSFLPPRHHYIFG